LDKGFSTGFGTETVAAGAKVLAALGVADADKFATNAQVFQAKATEAVLQKQLEQKGPQTESDAQRIDQIGAQLGKTTAGNRFVLTTAKEQLKRDMEQRDGCPKGGGTGGCQSADRDPAPVSDRATAQPAHALWQQYRVL
jgi:hypothetical protein